jgi:hypothetical protein
MNNTQQSV